MNSLRWNDCRMLLAVPLVIFLSLCYAYFPESIDDAYITLRYSKNLMLGHGPVFNVGEYVEGFSNPVWMALLAATGRIGLSMPFSMKVLGVLSGVGAILVTARAVSTWLGSMTLGVASALLVASSSFFALWAADGLETVFYTFVVTLLLWMATRDGGSPWGIGCVAALVALTRPEGAMFGVIVLGWIALRRGVLAAAKVALLFIAPVAAYEAFRLSYFGEWVANTAAAKVHTGQESVTAAAKYVLSYNRDSGYVWLPLAFLGALVGAKRQPIILTSLFVLAQGVFLVVSGGDFMFGYRFIMPVVPCLAMLVCAAAVNVSKKPMVGLASVVLVAAITGVTQYKSRPPIHIGADNLTRRASVHFAIADYLRARTSPQDTVLLSEAGIIPYYIDARVDDYLGLTSRYWYVRNKDRSLNVEHILVNNPKYVVLSFRQTRTTEITPRLYEDSMIFDSSEFKSKYVEEKRFDITRDASLLNFIYYFYSPTAQDIYFAVYRRRA